MASHRHPAKGVHVTEPSIPQDDSKTTPLFQQWLDLLSKGWVPPLAAVYGSGYLIVSAYHASLGLNAINLQHRNLPTCAPTLRGRRSCLRPNFLDDSHR